MNICLVTPEYPPFAGGIATYTMELARLLSDSGHSVVILCTDTSPPQRSLISDALRIVDLSKPQRAWYRRITSAFTGRARETHNVLAAGMAVRDWLLANAETAGINVVEVPDYQGVGACLGDLNLPACIIAGHGTCGQIGCHSGESGNSASRFVSELESIGLACSDAVVCHSHSYRRQIEEWVGRDVLFASAPHSCQESQKSSKTPTRDACDSPSRPLRLIVLGRLVPWKGPELLCDAIRIAQATTEITVDWYGSSFNTGPDNRAMTTQISEKYPELWGKAFKWHPPLPPTKAMVELANADALVIASAWETFGYTAIEAVTVGTPVIISDGAGASYLFRDNGAGIVFPSGDAGRLAEAIQTMTDVNARAAMSRAARSVIQSELAPAKVVAERITSYEVAMERKEVRRRNPCFPGGVGEIIYRLCAEDGQAEIRDVASLTAAQLLAVVGSRVKRRVARAIGWAADR